jgi:hypothetical protein
VSAADDAFAALTAGKASSAASGSRFQRPGFEGALSEVDEVPELLGGSPLVLPPPPLLLLLGGLVGEDVGGDVLVGEVGGVGVTEWVDGGGSLRPVVVSVGPPPGGGLPGPGLAGGVTTEVVGTPSAPTDTTVVGVDGVVDPSGVDGPVAGAPGTALPVTTCELPGRVPWPPPGTLPLSAAVLPGPASSATAAKAVATTRPPTPRMA